MTSPPRASPPSPLPKPSPQPAWRHLAAAVTLLPRGLCALAAVCAGRGAAAHRLLRAGTRPDAAPVGGARPGSARPGATRLLAYAVLTVLLGALAWVLAGALVLSVARGLFYGFVDDGPYDDSWGGPSRAGAWLAHFAVGTPFAFVAAGLLYGVSALRLRLTAPLRGDRRARWVLPVVLLAGAAGALFVVAWVRQLG